MGEVGRREEVSVGEVSIEIFTSSAFSCAVIMVVEEEGGRVEGEVGRGVVGVNPCDPSVLVVVGTLSKHRDE